MSETIMSEDDLCFISSYICSEVLLPLMLPDVVHPFFENSWVPKECLQTYGTTKLSRKVQLDLLHFYSESSMGSEGLKFRDS